MDRPQLANAIREQAQWCERLGSPLYHGLLVRMAEDVEAGGICWTTLESRAGDPGRSLLPLRFLGGAHRLALEGRLPRLARYYPSAGGVSDPEGAWLTLREELEQRGEALMAALPEKVQTNEVARCCALLPGFLEVARSTGLPFRLLEIGCSAGLNLRWDLYRYESAHGSWGPDASRVVFGNAFNGVAPALDTAVDVAERRGCDLNPLDPTTDDGRLTLLSFVWPDQQERFRQLANAIEVARTAPARLERADALEWLEAQLADQRHGMATVVFHSVVLLYFSREQREGVAQLITQAGKRATERSPLAWLAMEPGASEADVYLTIWPGGERKRIATAGYHGRNVTLE